MIARLLIANRGEIACRVMRTAQRLGIRCIAVHSDADAQAMHVAMADEAVRIGPASAADSYLNISALVAAVRATGADAVHPGYGFLSENPAFVDAVTEAGSVFVGPSAQAMRAMGLKDAAKRLMEESGVPVVPGYHAEAQDEATLQAAATAIGYPVLIKARAGGGGRGMRRVDEPNQFPAALESARREALGAFGDEAVLIEKYIVRPRHIEVQVFGDDHGNAVHLFERDCSLQRRHQKVLEEAPAPGLTEPVRDAMTFAAIRAAQAIDYTGAGTVEFIVDGQGVPRVDGFWFMEMNTRLQVEHPVTEAITGIDLVEWQLRVAAGEPLPLAQRDIRRSGHAVEARLYAEDAQNAFLPQTGTLERFEPRGGQGRFDDHGLRVDAGVRQGDTISPHYDPLLAKFIAMAPRRELAFARLTRQLHGSVVLGSVTNRTLLARLASDADVLRARLDTGLIERELSALNDGGKDGSAARAADLQCDAMAAWLLGSGLAVAPGSPAPRDDGLAGFRLWGDPSRQVRLAEPPVTFVVHGRGANCRVEREDAPDSSHAIQSISSDVSTATASLMVDGAMQRIAWWRDADVLELHAGDRTRRYRFPDNSEEAGSAADGSALLAPMHGRVLSISRSAGDLVEQGDDLVVLEAMKMEHRLPAPAAGRIESIAVQEGAQVARDEVLLTFVSEAGQASAR